MKSRGLLALLAIVLAAGAGVFYFRGRSNKEAPAPVSGYADPRVCAGCHAELAKTYRQTGMGRSFYRPTVGNAVEDYSRRNSFRHAASDRVYTMLTRDGRFYQRRSQTGYLGHETNVQETPVDYVIGSGNHARSYLHRTGDGRLVELPVSWYSEKGGYWAMSPGYDRANQQDARRVIPYECMFCHNGYPGQVTSDDPVFPAALPEGIDCQRCHGPGRAHVTAAGSGKASVEAIRGAIVNPARLDRDRQLDVCMQCHLETTSRPLPNSIRRYEHGPFAYRPGERLTDYFLYFDQAPGKEREEKFEIAHAGYRLGMSACFRAGKMTCTTCHNPHSVPRGPEAVAHYEAVCRSCHGSAHVNQTPAKTACLDCHMPKRRADDAVHVVMTDHYIQRRKPDRDLLAPLEEAHDLDEITYRGEVAPYYPAAADALYTALAQVQHGSNLAAGTPRLRAAIEKHKPEQAEFYFELGKAYSKGKNEGEAVRWFDEALRHRSDYRPAQRALAVSLLAMGNLNRAAEVLEKAPIDATLLTNLGSVYLKQSAFDRAEQKFHEALRVNADIPEAHNQLGVIALRKGDRAAAEASFREAIRLEPALAEAHNNLATLLAEGRDYAQAKYHFERAIAAQPDYADAHESYGMLLVLLKSYDAALRELQTTVKLDPQRAQAHADLADLFAARGRLAEAITEYRAAIASNPAHYEAHLALGGILARQGDQAEARLHFAKASESPDPAVRQAALAAQR